jgi:hypothetical protein
MPSSDGPVVDARFPAPLHRIYIGSMYTLELNDEELRLLRSAIGSCVRDYGHDEADIRRVYQALLARLPAPVAKAS